MIYGVVTLYFPTEKVIENIETYVHGIDKLFLFDNTPLENKAFRQKIKWKNIEYISFNENKGLSFAYNYCIKKAIEDNADAFLIMDQDSSFVDFYGKEKDLKSFLNSKEAKIYGQLSLAYKNKDEMITEKLCISSGSVIIIENYKLLHDGFKKDLFIDMIDYDISIQFLKINKFVAKMNLMNMDHELSANNLLSAHFLKRRWEIIDEPFYRYYYIVRNSRMLQSYKYFANFYTIKSLLICLFLNLRFRSVIAVLDGIRDAKKGKTGIYKKHQRYEKRKVKKLKKHSTIF